MTPRVGLLAPHAAALAVAAAASIGGGRAIAVLPEEKAAALERALESAARVRRARKLGQAVETAEQAIAAAAERRRRRNEKRLGLAKL